MKKDKRKKKKVKAQPQRNKYITALKEGVELGDSSAMFQLGLEYMIGDHIKKNPEKGHELFIQAAENGNSDAMCALGKQYMLGEGCVSDLEKAKLWYQRAASLGNKKAHKMLVNVESDFVSLTAETQKIEDQKKKVEAGDGNAAYDLYEYYKDIESYDEANYYHQEAIRLGSPRIYMEIADHEKEIGNRQEAIKKYVQAGEAGYAKGYLEAGLTSYQQQFTSESVENAIEYFEKALSLGVSEANAYLSKIYYGKSTTEEELAKTLPYILDGIDSDYEIMGDVIQNCYTEKLYDDQTLFTLSKKMADHGDSSSIARVAYMYLKGEGVKKDLKLGTKYLELCEDKDDFSGEWLLDILSDRPRDLNQAVLAYVQKADNSELYEIAKCYLGGVAVEQDIEKGLFLVEEASNRGVIAAKSLLGEIYLVGHYGQKDMDQGLELLFEAAHKADPRACAVLSRCYEIGYGVKKSVKLSDYYFSQYRDSDFY